MIRGRRGPRFVLVLVCALASMLLSPALTPSAAAAARTVITGVSPGAGPLSPSTVVIRGTNLQGVRAIRFGTRQGTIIGRPGARAIKVRTPSGMRPGTVSVRVKTKAGWSAPSARARFTFVPRPTLDRITPASGYFSGGQRITLTGRDLGTATRVLFGNNAAPIVARQARSIVVTTPVGVLGQVRVRVQTIGGISAAPGSAFTYTTPAPQQSSVITPASRTLIAENVGWVTGGYDADTGQANPWVVELPRGATVPLVGQGFLVRPGNQAFPSGLAGTVSEVAEQLDQTVRVTVSPSSLDTVMDRLRIDYSGPVTDSAATAGRGAGGRGTAGRGAAGRSAEVGRAAEFSVKGPTALFCRDDEGASVAVGVELTMTVTDVEVSQHLDVGGLIHRPTYDGAFTAELQTTGKITVAAASTCSIPTAWRNTHRHVIPLNAGTTLSFAPSLELKFSAKGTWSVVDRTRTTFALSAAIGRAPSFSRDSRTVESRSSGEGSFEAEVKGGVEMQLGIWDRAGLVGRVLLGVNVTATASALNACVEANLFVEFTLGVFLDRVWARWESDTLTAKITLARLTPICLLPEAPAPTGEPAITSARLADATIAASYEATLTTDDGRAGTWSVVGDPLPNGLQLQPAGGVITGTPRGPVGDYPVTVDFTDQAGRVATTIIRIRVQPRQGLGGGDVQAVLRWSGAADLDLHVVDPSGEEIYYSHAESASGGRLDHDANAGCNGATDDDNPVENVYWPTGQAPQGSYRVWVVVYRTCDAPLDWHLSVWRNGSLIVDQTGAGDSSEYSFGLGVNSQAHVKTRPTGTRTAIPGPKP